jgi:hypothetical protein
MQGLPNLLELEAVVALKVKQHSTGVRRHLLQPCSQLQKKISTTVCLLVGPNQQAGDKQNQADT